MAKVDKRQQIMLAAEKLFTTRRFHEITMEDVAHKAGVGKGTIYRYFRNKDDLFFETATAGFEELCELLRRKVPETSPFEEQLLGACEQISAFFERRRPLFRMMQAEENRMYWCRGSLRERWMKRRMKLVSAVEAIVRKGVVVGEIRDDIPAEILTQFLMGMLRTRGRDMADAPGGSPSHGLVVELFCRGAGTAAKYGENCPGETAVCAPARPGEK